jgi:hypothetical protein
MTARAWADVILSTGLNSSIDLETAQALLLHAENVQITFGAVLLSFLGAIHWGFEFSKFGGEVGNRRYALGLIPVAIAWPTLMLAPQMALVCQWAGFVATWFIDLRATTQGWAPKWYSSYRFALTLFVGTSILATLAGTGYYAVDQSASSGVGRRLRKASAEAAAKAGDAAERIEKGIRAGPKEVSKVMGDVQATESEDEDAFVKVSNPKRKEEERKKKEEEEKKKKEEEAKKKKEEESKKKDDGDKDKKKDDDGGKDKKKEDDDGDDDEE